MRAIVPIGRALFALIFITSVFSHFSSATIDAAAAHGVPLAAIVVPIAGLVAFAGGLSILLGYRARFGAFLLLVYLVPVTLVMHKFGDIFFMHNLSLIGTSLLVMYYGPGPISLDG
jgi:putative oxidoreductase